MSRLAHLKRNIARTHALLRKPPLHHLFVATEIMRHGQLPTMQVGKRHALLRRQLMARGHQQAQRHRSHPRCVQIFTLGLSHHQRRIGHARVKGRQAPAASKKRHLKLHKRIRPAKRLEIFFAKHSASQGIFATTTESDPRSCATPPSPAGVTSLMPPRASSASTA